MLIQYLTLLSLLLCPFWHGYSFKDGFRQYQDLPGHREEQRPSVVTSL